MSGPKRNPDKLNTIGVVVVGICGAVLVYVTIVALQAFYMNDTSEIQTMADYGGNDTNAKSIKAAAVQNITQIGANPAPKPGDAKPPTYHINIDDAMKLVVESAKVDPSDLIPSQGRSDKATIKPIPGRPQPLNTPAPAAPAPGTAPAPTDGAGSGSAAAAPPPPPPAGTDAPKASTGGLGMGGSPPVGGGPGSSADGPPPPAVTPATPPSKTPAPAAGSGSAAKGNAP